MHHPTDRIAHTTAFVTPVMEHWLEQEIAQAKVTMTIYAGIYLHLCEFAPVCVYTCDLHLYLPGSVCFMLEAGSYSSSGLLAGLSRRPGGR